MHTFWHSLLIAYIVLGALEESRAQSDVIVERAYFREAVLFDPGTVHILLRNKGLEDVRIEKVHIEAKIAWQRIVNDPIPAGGFADVIAKLRTKVSDAISYKIDLSGGSELTGGLRKAQEKIRITNAVFSENGRELYVYIARRQNDPPSVKKVFVNGKEIGAFDTILLPIIEGRIHEPALSVFGNVRLALIARSDMVMTSGRYSSIRVEAETEVAEVLVCNINNYPLVKENDQQKADLLFDSPDRYLHFEKIPKDTLKRTISLDRADAFLLWTGSSHVPHRIGSASSRILRRGKQLAAEAPHGITLIHLGRREVDETLCRYSEITDAVRIPIDAYIPYFKFLGGRATWSQFLVRLARRIWAPKPVHVVIPASQGGPLYTERPPSPEEIRLLVYNAVAAGAKGIVINMRGAKDLPDESTRALQQVAAELQVLKRFLRIGEAVDIAHTDDPKVQASVLLVGDRAMVLLLINDDNNGLWPPAEGGSKHRFVFQPKSDITVTVNLPAKFDIKDLYEVGQTWGRAAYSKEDSKLVIHVDELRATRQYVLTTDPEDYDHDADGDGISDITEASELMTHPTVSQFEIDDLF